MRDLWAFLLQTLTASGAASLLLAVKAVFRDKLSPRWQFAVWGILGVVLLIPAGLRGRYVLVNWPLFVETLRSVLTGEYGALTHVSAPVPLIPASMTGTAAEWAFLIYLAGAAALLARYAVSYLRLRLALGRGTPAGAERAARVQETAERYGLTSCPAVEVEGLSSAFICGVLRPVLALPAGVETDEKVILHELLHLKHRDAAWGLVICLFRCVHWCNPLLWYCADLAGNDLESLCDQRVLERLEGEDRRDYGRILLSMANERYARSPGTSSMANGGKNIRRRIESIARFKRYPAGMALVSVCVALVLAVPLAAGTRARAVRQEGGVTGVHASAAIASARTTYCTTYAGAFDAYAKAVLDRNVLYRAMCAPLAEQNGLAEQLHQARDRSSWPPDSDWDSGLTGLLDVWDGYQIYNLTPAGEDGYEGLLAVGLAGPPAGEEWDGREQSRWMAVQPLRAEKEGDRWVILPLGDFWNVQGDKRTTGNLGLPAWTYEARCGDFILRMRYQTRNRVGSYVESGDMFFSSKAFDRTPQPDGVFNEGYYDTCFTAVYTGQAEKRSEIKSVGASCAPMAPGEERPDLHRPGLGDAGGSSSDGSEWGVKNTFNWDLHGDEIPLGGGGGGGSGGSRPWKYTPPEQYAADFYLNGEKIGELTLLPVEGGPQ